MVTVKDIYVDEYSSGLLLRMLENPILSGYNSATLDMSSAYGIYYAYVQYEDVAMVAGEPQIVPSETGAHIGLFKAYPVPFKCKVHKPERFELGQTVVFPDHPNTFNNYRYGTTTYGYFALKE